MMTVAILAVLILADGAIPTALLILALRLAWASVGETPCMTVLKK